jgi:signal transduction histidine kinase
MKPTKGLPRAAWVLLWLAGIVFGVLTLAIVRGEPDYSLAGRSGTREAAGLVAGWALLAVGLVASARRPGSRFGALLIAASFGWFLTEWNNPGIGSALGFTLGLALFAIASPLVGHAALAYPDGRLSSWLDRVGLAAAYVGAVVVLGLFPAVVFDPASQGCECPRNLLLVHDSSRLYDRLNRVGVYAGLAWSLALIALLALRLVRSTPALRRLVWPVLATATAYLGLVAWDYALSLDRGFVSNDSVDRRFWLGEAAALCALALGVAWAWVRAGRTRSGLARLVIQLAQSPAPGGLREVLAGTLDDSSLQLSYPLADGRLVDARGRSVESERAVTPLVRGREEVALLAHRPGLLDDPVLAEEVAAAARLVLENERLQAEARAQLEDMRASRVRIVEDGDAERRRLERDLHDGAQQRLVSLSLALRLARSRPGSGADPVLRARIDEADGELRTALAELRELAHGIFPAVLADEGLGAALEALAEEAPIEITALPGERLDAPVEAAGYFVVSEVLRRSAASALKVGASRRGDVLVIEVEGDNVPDEIVDLEDRVGALDGTLEVVREPGGQVTMRAEIPFGPESA